jgi:hypothetical protein
MEARRVGGRLEVSDRRQVVEEGDQVGSGRQSSLASSYTARTLQLTCVRNFPGQVKILRAGWIRDGTWPATYTMNGSSRGQLESLQTDPFFASPPKVTRDLPPTNVLDEEAGGGQEDLTRSDGVTGREGMVRPIPIPPNGGHVQGSQADQAIG